MQLFLLMSRSLSGSTEYIFLHSPAPLAFAIPGSVLAIFAIRAKMCFG